MSKGKHVLVEHCTSDTYYMLNQNECFSKAHAGMNTGKAPMTLELHCCKPFLVSEIFMTFTINSFRFY